MPASPWPPWAGTRKPEPACRRPWTCSPDAGSGRRMPSRPDREQTMMLDEQYSDDERTVLLAEARYHLGRVLYEGELDFNRAVSELEEAIALDPSNIEAYYHLGKAIRI